MIALTLPEWILALLGVHLAILLVLSIFYVVRRLRWTPRRRATPFIFRCSVCGHVYLDRRNVPMAECAKCGNMNESIKDI